MTCTASGGTVVSSSLTGPGGVDLELQPMVSIGRTGQNTYSITSGTLSGRNDGNTYQCTAAANLPSPNPSDSAVLRGTCVASSLACASDLFSLTKRLSYYHVYSVYIYIYNDYVIAT